MGRAVALGQGLVAKWMWRTRKISNRQTDNDQLSSPECQCFPTCSGNTPDSPLRWGFTPNSSCSRGISTQPQQVRKLAAAESDFRPESMVAFPLWPSLHPDAQIPTSMSHSPSAPSQMHPESAPPGSATSTPVLP